MVSLVATTHICTSILVPLGALALCMCEHTTACDDAISLNCIGWRIVCAQHAHTLHRCRVQHDAAAQPDVGSAHRRCVPPCQRGPRVLVRVLHLPPRTQASGQCEFTRDSKPFMQFLFTENVGIVCLPCFCFRRQASY